jgi:ribonucleoside-diphosphate reductase alpha chain
MSTVHELETLKKSGEAPEFLTEAGYKTLSGGYMLPGETPKGLWTRVARAAAKTLKKPELESKFFHLFWNNYMGLATPIASNLGTDRGLPISCFGVHPKDSTLSLMEKATELAIMEKMGGGVGVYMGDIRPAGAKIGTSGATSAGIIPFAKIYDSVASGISQGVRRGAAAVYLPVDHQDFKSFLRMRRPEGDPGRQCLNLHHGVCITDEFMNRVDSGDLEAQELLRDIYKSRLETGEPYIMFVDTVQRADPEAYKKLGLKTVSSQICSEITLFSDWLHSFVCCVSSMNLTKWEEWKNTDAVYYAIWFLDAVLQEFVEKARAIVGMEAAVRFAEKSRALGLGVLGWHTLLQSEGTAFDSFRATVLNKAIFNHIKKEAVRASQDLAKEYGEPEWMKGTGLRNSHLLAVAPTASNSIISGDVSPGIEPINANIFAHKTAKATFIKQNPLLKQLLAGKGKDDDSTWTTILKDEGSVRSLPFLSIDEKNVFKTATEIDQRILVQQAADRQAYVCQAQSLNLFFAADVDPQYFHDTHHLAWKSGVKTLYYVRSSSVLKADLASRNKDDDCVACQA